MTTIALRKNLVKSINKIEDRDILNALSKIISKNKICGSKKSELSLKGYAMEVFLDRNERAENDLQKENVFANEEFFDFILNKK